MAITENENVISCHSLPEGERAEWNDEQVKTCSVCSSVHPDEFVWGLLHGQLVSGWHWVDSEPLYCTMETGRFYFRHLIDMDCEWLHTYAVEIFARTGVLFFWEKDWLKYHALQIKSRKTTPTKDDVLDAQSLNDKYFRKQKR